MTSRDPRQQPNAMQVEASGDLFYPVDEYDARWFHEQHGALPLWPSVFPFDLRPVPVVRALVTLTVEVLSREPIEITANELTAVVQDRFGRVCDGGPYSMVVSPYGQVPRVRQEFRLGALSDGPVVWVDGGAPEHGFHCRDCREPLNPDAGPCRKMVVFRCNEYPCASPDEQHHGGCWARLPGLSTPDVA